jgi:CRISPR/Cas system-associated exonuclease Cas4 (RecB family)
VGKRGIIISMPYPASYFRLSMFRQCRQRYKLHYVDGVADIYRKARSYLTMGEHVHGALRDLFSLPVEERSEDRLIQLMRDRWRRNREGFTDLAEEKLYGEKATAQLRLFAQREDLTIQPVAVEDFHKVEIDDTLALLGKIDRIDREGDGLHIIDYKTGAPREPDPLQLQMYALIVAREFDPAPIRASYHYLGTGEWITQEATEETMAQALEDVRQRVAVIVAEREYPASPGPLCGYCDFLEICRGGRGFVESHPVVLEEELSLE